MQSCNDSCFVPVRFGNLMKEPPVISVTQADESAAPNGQRMAKNERGEEVGGMTELPEGCRQEANAVGNTPGANATRFAAPISFAEFQSTGSVETKWLWHGYLAAGRVTLLTSLWKSGKTTLVSVLLARMQAGGMLAGRAVAAGRAVVLSEEDVSMWRERGRRIAFGPQVSWYCRPFLGKPRLEDWQGLLEQIGCQHERERIDFLVVDSLANLSPMRSENEAGEMLKTLQPLQALTSRGMCVLVLHHPRKGEALPGQAARGSGALLGFVDIILEMQRISRANMKDRRRRLRAYSRFRETPPKWIIELTPDGGDYVSLGESAQPTFDRGGPVLKQILERAEGRLTWRQIVQRWPEDTPAPAKATISRWLDKLLEERHVLREGRGTSNDPYVYLLPGMEIQWQDDMLKSLVR